MLKRIIKFRVWDEKTNSWDRCKDGSHFCLYPETELLSNGRVFQQYTGLKDKNDKEIFEGDILKHLIDEDEFLSERTANREIIFNNGIFGLPCVIFKNNVDNLRYYSQIGEVIGNIFENPELLK